jgi:ceramide glucosyltransferase
MGGGRLSVGLAAALGLALTYLGLLGGKAFLALRACRRERLGPADARAPGVPAPRAAPAPVAGAGVTVAQAILSGDARLGEVLEANVAELPGAQFLWLVDVDDEVAQAVCGDIARRWDVAGKARRIEILVLPPPPAGHNPKLHKLNLGRVAFGEPVLLVLDDDTRMPAATLATLVAALDRAALATSLPGYLDDGRWPSRLLAQFVDNNAALTYLPLLAFLPPLTINGMAYALRCETLDAIGGFAPLLGFLTDDLAVAQQVIAAGGTIEQSARPHWVETTVRGGGHYVQLMHRWFLFALLLMKKQPLRLRLVIALLDAVPPLLLLGLVVIAAMEVISAVVGVVGIVGVGEVAAAGAAAAVTPVLTVLAATLGLRGFCLAGVQRAVYGRALHAPLTSVVSELLQPFHLLHAACRRRIVWRTRRYRVYSESRFTSLP